MMQPNGNQDSARDRTHEARDPREPGDSGTAREPTETMKQTNPPRSNMHPEQTAEVPHGTGHHPEPPGGGGRASQPRKPEDTRKP
jgi:hypothetical protein